jgi:hypothetical protein
VVSIVAALLCFGFPQPIMAVNDPVPAEVIRFLSAKKVVGSIEFSANSAQLTSATRAQLRDFVAQANNIAKETDLLRVEGRADEGIILAIERAKAVVQFLQEELKSKYPIYFTGIAPGDGNRADLFLYENTLAGNVDEKELFTIFFD